MAKSSTGRTPPTKGKPAPPVAARTKAKSVAVVPKKSAAGKVVAKLVAPKKTAASLRKAAVAKVVAPTRAEAPKQVVPPPMKATRASALPVKTTGKIVAVKQAAARRPPIRTPAPVPAARRTRTVVPKRTVPAAAARDVAAAVRKVPGGVPAESRKIVAGAPNLRKTGVDASHVFTVSHLNQDDFKVDGLRTYAKYRDLGIAAATGGLCQAHVIRFTPPCTDEVRKRHVHHAELQLIYVLQGWMKNEFEGHGEQMMSTGSCWLQPSGVKHTVLDYSADCEVLEIIVPADFKTEELV